MNLRCFLVAASTCFAMTGPALSDNLVSPSGFSPEAWKQAKHGSEWTRKELWNEFWKQHGTEIEQKKISRSQIVKLLGEPELICETFDKHRKTLHSWKTYEYYQYASKNASISFEYDAQNMVSHFNKTDNTLELDRFQPNIKYNAQATVAKAREAAKCANISAIEKLLGLPTKTEEKVRTGTGPYAYSSYTWRLSADGKHSLDVVTRGILNNKTDDSPGQPNDPTRKPGNALRQSHGPKKLDESANWPIEEFYISTENR